MKKGITVAEMGGIALAFVVVAIIIGIASIILSQTQSTQCVLGSAGFNATTGTCLVGSTTLASNITGQGVTGLATMGAWLPTIAVIIAAAVVIGIIVSYFRQ